MTLFDKLREKNKAAAFLDRLLNTSFYPILFAVICVISGTNNKDVYIPCIWFLTFTVVIAGLFSKDLKVFLVPFFTFYYCIGLDVSEKYFTVTPWNNGKILFDKSSMYHFIACGAICLLVLLYRLISEKLLKEMFLKRGIFFWGIIAIDVALLFNGAFSPWWEPMNILYGLMIGGILTLCYCLFLAILSHSKDPIPYLCKALIFTALAIIAQLIIIFLKFPIEISTTSIFGLPFPTRAVLTLAWGLPTISAAVIALAIPASLYLAKNARFPILSCSLALIFLISTVLINTRSAILFGGIAFVVGLILCCFKNKNKLLNRIFTISLFVLGFGTVMIFLFKDGNPKAVIEKVIDTLRFDFLLTDNSTFNEIFGARAKIWSEAIKTFPDAPIFGTGFSLGRDMGYVKNYTVFDTMYHNVLIEFLCSMGLVGVFAFLFHMKHGIEVIIRRISAGRVLILLVPILILGMSLLDNFFFYPNFLIIYAAFLAGAECMLEKSRQDELEDLNKIKKGKKPRVVFAYVEAGKGHIVPTKNVCEAFKAKYGDRAEVIESKFFSETNNKNMQKTEKLFEKAVQQQNRSPILSVLCKIGNFLAGNTFARYVLLTLSISGIKTNPLAVKHVEELDANVIYTAHWAIPYYVNQMQTPKPYTICFCPDVISNGAFDVDCNNFLMSTKKGYKKVLRDRMYAGGNISLVPFPIRKEREEYLLPEKRLEIRASLGLKQDDFVITLCDGGYGMARLEKTVKHLLKSPTPITVIALCGMNKPLFEKLKKISSPKNVRLIPVSFTDSALDYICIADIFIGKSGANSMAEPASLGVPIIITKCITYIERNIKNYYVHDLKGALYIPNAKLAANKAIFFATHKDKLDKLRNNLISSSLADYDAEASADLIWQRVLEMQE